MGNHTDTCTTCGKPADPHPYRHRITLAQRPTPTGCAKCAGCGQVANTVAQEPWPLWLTWKAKQSDVAEIIALGLIHPIPCPACGPGERTVQIAPNADFNAAMRLLGLDPDNPERPLVTVHIEEGLITAKYAHVVKVGGTEQTP